VVAASPRATLNYRRLFVTFVPAVNHQDKYFRLVRVFERTVYGRTVVIIKHSRRFKLRSGDTRFGVGPVPLCNLTENSLILTTTQDNGRKKTNNALYGTCSYLILLLRLPRSKPPPLDPIAPTTPANSPLVSTIFPSFGVRSP